MTGLSPNLVVLFPEVLAHPGLAPACARLAREGYEIAVAGLPSPAALQGMARHGVSPAVHEGDPALVVARLRPAVVVFSDTPPPLRPHVPHRLCLAPRARDSSSQVVGDFSAWVEAYLAPRVPRTYFQRTSP